MQTKVLILFLLFMQLTGCTFNEKEPLTEIEEEVPEIERTYTEVSDFELTWDSVFDVDESKYYVYFYSITCAHCKELQNYIIDTALKRGDVYFVKGTSKDQITSDTKKLIGAEIPGDIWILGYPSLLKILDKKVTKNLAGSSQIKSELK